MADQDDLTSANASINGGVRDVYGEDSASIDQVLTPWVRTIASGVELLREPRFNKGLAFTEAERERHYLKGLLPPVVITGEMQVQRLMHNIRQMYNDLLKYIALMDTQDRNERLFYRALAEHVEELMPIVYTPTVGEACQKYGAIFHRPRGLYISIKDKGSVLDIVKNWTEINVAVIVVTDGERILGLGDLGLQGMGIPVGKLALYTALGGVRPSACLPVTLDVGTNNQKLLDDPFYIGLRQKRATGKEYDDFVEEFMVATKKCFGETVLVQFEDFANHNAFRLLEKYRDRCLTFNDDIQGTASVALAGVLASLPITGTKLEDHKYLFLGAGEAGTGIAEIITKAIVKHSSLTIEQARERIFLVDSKGLVVNSRFESLQHNKKPFSKDHEPLPDLISSIKALHPTVLIGTSAQPGTFTEECLTYMSSYCDVPIVFALSNPTSRCECTAEQAYKWTKGKALFASGSPFGPVEVNGELRYSGQSNNAYIFPGMGLACIVSGAIRVSDDMFLAAAEALADQVTDEHRKVGLLFPPFTGIRKISARLAADVAQMAYDIGVATNLPKPKDLVMYAESSMYNPLYRKFR